MAAGVLFFTLLARWVLSGASMPFDTAIRAAVHAWASPPLTAVMLAITSLGAQFSMVPLGAILVWHWAATGRRRLALHFAVLSLSAELLSQLLKLAFARPRPPVFFRLSPAETYSFPSGHAFVATVFYGLAAMVFLAGEPSRRKRAAIAAAAWLASLAIGFSRIYLGYHYPSDVLGGWAAAIAWLALANQTTPAARLPSDPRGQRAGPGHAPPRAPRP